MNKLNPFSAFYYMKQNKGRAILGIFMMCLATLMFLTGNYIESEIYPFEKEFEYSDQIVIVGIQSTDEDYQDYKAFKEQIEKDDKLQYVESSAWGFSSMSHGSVLGFEMGGTRYIFNSKEDMLKIFDHLGITGDFSNCKDRSLIISEDFAKNKGIHLNDTLDKTFDPALDRSYTVDALIDDGSFISFYIFESDESLGRLYIYSDSMSGKELYSYVNRLATGKQVQVGEPHRDTVLPQFDIFYVIFYLIDIMVALVLAVTVNSVFTGQYMKRVYEFGVYRAIGRRKREVRKKVAKEILSMNLIACIIGFSVIELYSYLMNELVYANKGLHIVYGSKAGFLGFLICDFLIVVPLILLKGRMMCKADVTEF